MNGPYKVDLAKKKITLSLPLVDAPSSTLSAPPYDFYEILFRALVETEMGVKGALRFSMVNTVLSPRLNKERGLGRCRINIHRCTLLSPRELPTDAQVASFFSISSQQVEAVLRSFYAPPEPRVVPPHVRRSAALTLAK